MSSSKKIETVTLVTLKPSEIAKAITHMSKTVVSTFIWGPPGIGKSQVIKQIADSLGYDFIDIRLSQMDPTDLRGIPYPFVEETKDAQGNVVSKETLMYWSTPAVMPRNPDAKAIILLDEFNSAPPSVQAGAYQLVLDRKLGEYSVPKGCMIIAAGNRETDKGITFRMPTPIANRFVHLEMKHDFDDWLRWALNSNVSKDVVGYLSANKHELFTFEAASASRGFQTPRSWSFVDQMLSADGMDGLSEHIRLGLVAGAIGDGNAYKFIEYAKHAAYLPKPEDVLSGKVNTLEKKDVSLCYALITALCYELKEGYEQVKSKKLERDAWDKRADNFCGFALDNFAPEVAVMGARVALATFSLPFSAKNQPNFKRFSDRYKNLILQN